MFRLLAVGCQYYSFREIGRSQLLAKSGEILAPELGLNKIKDDKLNNRNHLCASAKILELILHPTVDPEVNRWSSASKESNG